MQNKYSFKFTPTAINDIDTVLDYISNHLQNYNAASHLYEEIEKSIDRICSFPMSGSSCEYFYITDNNVRHTIIGNYVLVYEIKEELTQINILRFCYGKQNFKDNKII